MENEPHFLAREDYAPLLHACMLDIAAATGEDPAHFDIERVRKENPELFRKVLERIAATCFLPEPTEAERLTYLRELATLFEEGN